MKAFEINRFAIVNFGNFTFIYKGKRSGGFFIYALR